MDAAVAACVTLNDYPTFGGVTSVAYGMMNEGMTVDEAVETLAYAVNEICPQHIPLVNSWAQAVTDSQPVAKY